MQPKASMSDTTDHLPSERAATDLAVRVLELEAEIERLRQDLLDVEFIEALREVISVAALTGTIGAPVTAVWPRPYKDARFVPNYFHQRPAWQPRPIPA
jgi:hypothetical protein